jgi:hypothetical protein
MVLRVDPGGVVTLPRKYAVGALEVAGREAFDERTTTHVAVIRTKFGRDASGPSRLHVIQETAHELGVDGDHEEAQHGSAQGGDLARVKPPPRGR